MLDSHAITKGIKNIPLSSDQKKVMSHIITQGTENGYFLIAHFTVV